VRDYETELFQFLDTRRPQLLSSLAEKGQIDDAIKADLVQALKEFGETFAAGRKTTAA
jgi:F0F1-type ATP synthase alpha subunit